VKVQTTNQFSILVPVFLIPVFALKDWRSDIGLVNKLQSIQ